MPIALNSNTPIQHFAMGLTLKVAAVLERPFDYKCWVRACFEDRQRIGMLKTPDRDMSVHLVESVRLLCGKTGIESGVPRP